MHDRCGRFSTFHFEVLTEVLTGAMISASDVLIKRRDGALSFSLSFRSLSFYQCRHFRVSLGLSTIDEND